MKLSPKGMDRSSNSPQFPQTCLPAQTLKGNNACKANPDRSEHTSPLRNREQLNSENSRIIPCKQCCWRQKFLTFANLKYLQLYSTL